MVSALPFGYRARLGVLRSMFSAARLHGVEGTAFAEKELALLRTAFDGAACFFQKDMAHKHMANLGAVLSLLDGATDADLPFLYLGKVSMMRR